MTELVSALASVAVTLADCWVCTVLLPMRRQCLFWVVSCLGVAASWVVRTWNFPPANLVGFLFCLGVVPCLFWRASWSHRLAGAAFVILMQMTLEAMLIGFFAAIGVGITGVAADAGAPVLALALRVSNCASVVAVGMAFRQRAGRALSGGAEFFSGSLAAFFAVQTALLVFQFYLPSAYGIEDPRAYLGLLGVFVVCACAEVAAMRSLARLADAERERARAALLEERLEGYLEGSRGALLAAGEAARLRHDRANHLRVVRGLAASGESGRALAYVRQLRDGL